MRKWKAAGVAVVLAGLLAPALAAQDPTVQELQEQVRTLREEMERQRESFVEEIEQLKGRLEGTIEQELEDRIEEIVASKSMFYSRPVPGSTVKRSLFTSLRGGLIFTGLFRTRFEVRLNNIDFNSGDSGLDDEGVRFNGRFRLGFGTVLVGAAEADASGTQISALTEFQATGTFADNSFVNIPGPGGIPLPSAFNILTEPFEEVRLYQGYLNFERLIHENVFIKAGRQEIIFGNEFVMGNNSFYTGTTHDAFLIQWRQEGLRISAWYGKEAASDSNTVSGLSDFDEDQFAGLYVSWNPKDDVELEAYAIWFDARSVGADLFVTGSNAFFLDGAVTPFLQGHFWTFGARLFWTRISFLGGFLSVNAEAAYQTGSNSIDPLFVLSSGVVTDQSLHGWSGEFLLNWRIDPSGEGVKPIFTVGYYYAGGGEKHPVNPSGFPLSDIGFQPLFINRHFDIGDRDDPRKPYHPGGGRYGNMDLIPLTNVHLAKAAISIAPSEKSELGIGYVLAVTADDEGYGTGIWGHEIDLFGAYKYSEHLHFLANASIFFPGDTAEDFSTLRFFGTGFPGEASDDVAFAFYLQALIEF